MIFLKMSWQLTFLPVFLIVFWLLLVLKNLSSFRKEFQKMDRKERSTELGKLFIKYLQKKYLWRSILAMIFCFAIYVLVYFIIRA
ncbi:hypothetical protein CW736_08615 [Nonlabens sp. MB-3u-79]|nr:hypothetical protein CW736_08615 [Nonlabens sp. MB-3u-79]